MSDLLAEQIACLKVAHDEMFVIQIQDVTREQFERWVALFNEQNAEWKDRMLFVGPGVNLSVVKK